MKETQGSSPDRRLNVGTPHWVKVFRIIALVLLLVFVALHLSGHGVGGHGMRDMPGMDMNGADRGDHGARFP